MYTIQVNGQIMEAVCCEEIVADSINMLEIKFNFSNEWVGLTKTAQFSQKQEDGTFATYNVLIDETGMADFPNEIKAGIVIISVFGVGDEGWRRMTTAPLAKPVEKSGFIGDGETPIPPTPDLYQQIIAEFNAAMAGKAEAQHTHAQSDITGFDEAMAGKAEAQHTHAQSDITGFDEAMAGKAEAQHTHPMSDITGMKDALNEAAQHVHYTFAKRVYVDITKGNDITGDGTSGNPFQTLDKLFEDTNTKTTDVRCYIVGAGDYHITKSVINALAVHITAKVEGVNLIFDSTSLAIYNSHLNICGESSHYINLYGWCYLEGGTAAFDYCNIHARIGSYFARMSYANCTIHDPPEGAKEIIWNYGSNVVLNSLTMNNTRNDLTVFYFNQCTVSFTGSWTENDTTDPASNSCFAEFAYSFATILTTKRVLSNPYTHNLKNVISNVIFRSEGFYTSWRDRCAEKDFSMPYAGIITYFPMRPITITTTDADGTARSFEVVGREREV